MLVDPVDAFTFGIGCDIAGATLLARGVLGSDAQIAMASSARLGWNPVDLHGRIADRVDGSAGLAGLILGFVAQAVGYALGLGGATSRTGTQAVLTGVAFAVVGAGLVGGGWRATRDRRLRARMIAVARVSPATGLPLPQLDVERLRAVGVLAGKPQRIVDGRPESDMEYCVRVFGPDAVDPPA